MATKSTPDWAGCRDGGIAKVAIADPNPPARHCGGGSEARGECLVPNAVTQEGSERRMRHLALIPEYG